MRKRFISLVLCGAVTATAVLGVTACGPSSNDDNTGGTQTITIWASGHEHPYLLKKDDAGNPKEGILYDYIKEYEAREGKAYPYNLELGDVGESDTESKFGTDASAGADVFGFVSNMLNNLNDIGALARISPEASAKIEAENMPETVTAVKVGDKFLAYPYTSDNGYCLFYDKNVIPDAENMTLQEILDACVEAQVQFIMPMTDAFYVDSFTYGAGGYYTASYDDDGHYLGSDTNYDKKISADSEYTIGQVGYYELAYLQSLTKKAETRAYIISGGNDEVKTAANVGKLGAAVTGTWNAPSLKSALDSGYAACALPDWVSHLDGNTYNWSAFIGYKMIGVNPHSKNLAEAHRIAQYITSEAMQEKHFDTWLVGPSNTKVANLDKVKDSVAFKAITAQRAHSVPQLPFPASYWSALTSLGTWLQGFTDAEGNAQLSVENLQTRIDQLVKELKGEM